MNIEGKMYTYQGKKNKYSFVDILREFARKRGNIALNMLEELIIEKYHF